MHTSLGIEIKTSAQLAQEKNQPIPTGSTSITVLSILKAMESFNQELEGDWSAVTPHQKAFFEHCYPYIDQLNKYAKDELFGKISTSHEVLNAFLGEQGFDIQLDPLDPDSIGVVAILKLLLQWRETAETTSIAYEGKTYPAVQMKEHLRFFGSPAIQTPILGIWPQKEDTIVMMVPADARYEGIHLLFRILEISKEIKGIKMDGYDEFEVSFPMVSLTNEADVQWLINLQKGEEWFVSQALQENKLRINQHGATAESATAMVMTRGISEVYEYVIDQPFFFFTLDTKTRFPTFIAYLAPDSWKDPESE
ncbi:MAG: serpin family protein [Flammeovirgaceae bacterium]